jgi:hypothetical protein
MQIEFLYIEGCPNVQPTLDRLRRVLREYGQDLPIIETNVGNNDAVRLRFLGSPTVRINDVDIELAARLRTGFGIMCRTYEQGGIPSEEMIRNAIAEAEGE